MSRPLRRFTLRLALARGISHAELLHTTSAREIAEYRALNLIDPIFDGPRTEIALASLANLTHNLHRHPDTEATTVDKWIPDYEARFMPPEQPEDEISRALDQWAMQINNAKHR